MTIYEIKKLKAENDKGKCTNHYKCKSAMPRLFS